MNNVRSAPFENRWQPVVHAVVESRPFAQIVHFDLSFLQQPVEIATQTARVRNDYWLITLAVQAHNDVNRYTLGTTGAQHRNDMDYFNLLHGFGS